MKKRGPTRAQVVETIELMGDGFTLLDCCKRRKLAYTTVKRKIAEDEELRAVYARARGEYADAKVQLMAHIAKTTKDVQRARLMCDNIKWEAAKVLPKVYGDRIDVNASVSVSLVQMVEQSLKE